MARNFYYVREAAALLGCTTQLVTRRIHLGDIPAGRIGKGRWRIYQQDILDYAKKHGIVLNFNALREPEGKINGPVQPSPKPYPPEQIAVSSVS